MKLLLVLLALSLPASALTITEQLAAAPEGTWIKITGTNTLQSVDPEKDPATNLNYSSSASYRGTSGFKGMIEAYSGGVKAWNRGTCGTILYMGGGHADYRGSGVYEFDPCGPVTWRRIGDPYDIKGTLLANPTGVYPDGSPIPVHTGQTLIWTGKELIVLLAQVETVNPKWKPVMMLFDPEKPKGQQWRQVENANSGAEWGISLWDSKRGLACWQGFTGAGLYPGVHKTYQCYDPAANIWTEYQPYADNQLNNYGALGGYNPELDLVTQLNVYKYSTARQFQIGDRDNGNPTVNWKRGVMVNKPDLETELSGFGSMVWSDHRKAWIYFPDLMKTGHVYQIKTTLVGGLPTHTWSAKLNADASLPSCGAQPTCGAGSWDKFAVFKLGDHEALCGVLTVAGDVSCFKLPGTILPPPPPGPVCMPSEYIGLPVCGAQSFTCPPGALFCENFTTGHTGAFYAGSEGVPVLENGRMRIDVPAVSTGNNHGGIAEEFPVLKDGDLFAFTYERETDQVLPGMKEWILAGYGSACQGQSFVQTHYIERPSLLVPYTECGARSFNHPLPNGDLQLQGSGPGTDFDCRYSDKAKNDLRKCATTAAGVKQTYYVEIKIGHYGQPDSTIDMWQRNGAGQCLKYAHVEQFPFVTGNGFGRMLFDAYMTGRTAADGYPAATVWFDNIAGSKQSFKSAVCG